MDRGRLRLPLAMAAVLAAAEGAAVLLRPRSGVIRAAPVDAGSYFSATEIQRARAFRRPQLALHGANVLIEATVLAALARRPPDVLRRPRKRPLLAGAAAAAGLSAGLGAATLPASALARRRSLAAGLATQSWRGWAADSAKAGAISAGTAGAGAAGLLGLVRRRPDGWWAPAAAAAVGAGVLFTAVAPVVLDPVFNRFDPLPDGETRRAVLSLSEAAGVRVREVYRVDASRRTTAANAYVAGLGATKRVVLYDTLLDGFTPEEVRLVVAHELAHVRHRDLPRGLAFLALTAPAATLAAQRLAERLTPGPDASLAGAGPAALPALALGFGAASVLVSAGSRQLSRRIEARADTFALMLTGAPEPFISFERRIALLNLADPDPPAWLVRMLATHPPTVERIGIGVAYRDGARA